MPERMRGPVSSITATRLLVVPKSMPTIGDFSFPKSIWKDIFHFSDQVSNVPPAVEQCANLFQVGCRGQGLIDRVSHRDKPVPSLDQLRPRRFVAFFQLLQSHIEFEHFFEQLRRSFLRKLNPF